MESNKALVESYQVHFSGAHFLFLPLRVLSDIEYFKS